MDFFKDRMMEAALTLDLLKQWCDGGLTRTSWKDLIATLQIWYSIQPSYSIHYLGTLFHDYTGMNLFAVFALCSTDSSTPAWSQWWWKRLERRPGWSSGEEPHISFSPLSMQNHELWRFLQTHCREEAGVQDSFLTYEVYQDDITMQLVADACKLLGK